MKTIIALALLVGLGCTQFLFPKYYLQGSATINSLILTACLVPIILVSKGRGIFKPYAYIPILTIILLFLAQGTSAATSYFLLLPIYYYILFGGGAKNPLIMEKFLDINILLIAIITAIYLIHLSGYQFPEFTFQREGSYFEQNFDADRRYELRLILGVVTQVPSAELGIAGLPRFSGLMSEPTSYSAYIIFLLCLTTFIKSSRYHKIILYTSLILASSYGALLVPLILALLFIYPVLASILGAITIFVAPVVFNDLDSYLSDTMLSRLDGYATYFSSEMFSSIWFVPLVFILIVSCKSEIYTLFTTWSEAHGSNRRRWRAILYISCLMLSLKSGLAGMLVYTTLTIVKYSILSTRITEK